MSANHKFAFLYVGILQLDGAFRYGVPGRDHVKALFWREQILLSRNSSAQVYRYTQMVVLAIMLSTLFLRGEVTNTDSIRVRFPPRSRRHLLCSFLCMLHNMSSGKLR
jgi:hypothetical protein